MVKLSHIAVIAGLVLGGAGTARNAQAETTLRLISGFPPNITQAIDFESVFIKEVLEQSGGELKIVRSGPEVVGPFEQLQPASAGVFDLLFTTASYSQSSSGVLAVIDSLTTDIDRLRDEGAIDWLNKYYTERFNLMLLGTAPFSANHFVLREPLSKDNPTAPLTGRKIRANAAYEGIVRKLGAAPVNMALAELFAAMEKGVVDGMAFPIAASAQLKVYQLAKYMARPGWGHSNNVLLVNVSKFNSLTEAQRKILTDAALKVERSAKERFIVVAKEDEAAMLANGVTITEFAPEIASELNALVHQGNYETARRSDPENVDKFWEFAKSKDLFEK